MAFGHRKANVVAVAMAVAGMFALATPASAASFNLTNGTLSVTIGDNGAIDTLTFTGIDFYNPGTPVSDIGLQVGTNTATFRLNTTTGGVAIPGSSTNPTWTGTYAPLGGTDNVTKTYSLVSGLNVLQVTTTLTNNTGSAITIRAFDTFDPDQGTPVGAGASTFNDIYLLGSGNVMRSTSNAGANSRTVVMGYSPEEAFGGGSSSFGLGVSNGTELNACFATPFDPNGAFSDIGICIGAELTIAAGGSVTWTYYQAYGLTQAAAEAAFLAAVPEPTTLLLFGLGLAGAARRLRRRRA